MANSMDQSSEQNRVNRHTHAARTVIQRNQVEPGPVPAPETTDALKPENALSPPLKMRGTEVSGGLASGCAILDPPWRGVTAERRSGGVCPGVSRKAVHPPPLRGTPPRRGDFNGADAHDIRLGTSVPLIFQAMCIPT